MEKTKKSKSRKKKSINWIRSITIFIPVIVVIPGAFFTLYIYFKGTHEKQIDTAREYMKEFYQGSYNNAWLSLNSFWKPHADEIFQKSKSDGKELSNYIVTTIQQNEELQNSSDQIISFFDSLKKCICNKDCDGETIIAYIGKDSLDLYGLYYPYIIEQRKKLHDESFGRSLVLIAKSYRDKTDFYKLACD